MTFVIWTNSASIPTKKNKCRCRRVRLHGIQHYIFRIKIILSWLLSYNHMFNVPNSRTNQQIQHEIAHEYSPSSFQFWTCYYLPSTLNKRTIRQHTFLHDIQSFLFLRLAFRLLCPVLAYCYYYILLLLIVWSDGRWVVRCHEATILFGWHNSHACQSIHYKIAM